MVYHTSFTSQRVRSEASWSLGQDVSMKFQILSERIPFAGQGTTCSLPLTDSKASPHRLILVVFKGGKAPLPVSPQYRPLSTLSFVCVHDCIFISVLEDVYLRVHKCGVRGKPWVSASGTPLSTSFETGSVIDLEVTN